jgi:hypothetical protein
MARGDGATERARAILCAHLRARRQELEHTIVSELTEPSNLVSAPPVENMSEIEAAVSAGVDHGIRSIEREGGGSGPIPAVLLEQAEKAARRGLELELLLRRYLTAYSLYCDQLIQAAQEAVPTHGSILRSAMRGQGILFERTLLGVMQQYTREQRSRAQPEWHLAARVKKLLAGEQLDADKLGYDFGLWHVGAIVGGSAAVDSLRRYGQASGHRLLVVRPEADVAWAWVGARRQVPVDDLVSAISTEIPAGAIVAIGEPARGIEGWRLTHQQADVAFTMARHAPGRVVTYASVGLLASVSRDRLLARSLRQLYLVPLAESRDGGATLRRTLRAYFAAEGNTSSAASGLEVSRQTVGTRLRTVEGRLGRTIESCAPALQLALQLADLDESPATPPPPSNRNIRLAL